MTRPQPLQIGLLLCDDVDGDSQEHYGTYSEMFQNSIDASSQSIQLTPIHCHKGDILPEPDHFSGYIISGSRYGAYESHSWILDLQAFIRQCWKQNNKVVGICFGHQMIAQALGGTVVKVDAGWGFGIHSTCITHRQPWMKNRAGIKHNSYNLIVIHQDQVITLPPGFKNVAKNDFCPNSMIVADGKMLGIQGHPEFNKAFCRFRADTRRALIGEEVYQSAMRSLETMDTHSATVLDWVTQFLHR